MWAIICTNPQKVIEVLDSEPEASDLKLKGEIAIETKDSNITPGYIYDYHGSFIAPVTLL